jgi:hypothetical protein
MTTRLDDSLDRLAEYSDRAILDELRRVATKLGCLRLKIEHVENHARCSYAIIKQRFGGLTKALGAAGLCKGEFNRNVTDDELLDELERIWNETLATEGRRPFKTDLARYHSRYSQGPYYRRWKSWIRACEAVLARSERSLRAKNDNPLANNEASSMQRRMGRKQQVPLGIRWKVHKRDGFRCVACGRSPATHIGTILHCDHVLAEARGGRTIEDNLRTLCQDCNIGKGSS